MRYAFALSAVLLLSASLLAHADGPPPALPRKWRMPLLVLYRIQTCSIAVRLRQEPSLCGSPLEGNYLQLCACRQLADDITPSAGDSVRNASLLQLLMSSKMHRYRPSTASACGMTGAVLVTSEMLLPALCSLPHAGHHRSDEVRALCPGNSHDRHRCANLVCRFSPYFKIGDGLHPSLCIPYALTPASSCAPVPTCPGD